MAINKLWVLSLVLVAAGAWSRETASVSDCQSAAAKPSIARAKAAVDRAPGDLRANYGLADAWSDAGCFSDAVQVLQAAQAAHPDVKELETRLRVARSLIGEEHYFDTLDRADADAKLKRDTFRCSTLSDLEACSEAVRLKPDDAVLLTSQADALMHAKRPQDALAHYRRAAALAPNPELTAKLNAVEAQLPGGHSGAAANEDNAGGRLTAGAQSAATSPVQAKPQKPIRVARLEPTPSSTVPEHRYSNAPQDERSH